MAMRFHCVAAYSDENKFLKVLYAGEDGEHAVNLYHAARDAAEFPRLAYFRNPPHSKRCTTVKAAPRRKPEPVPAPAPSDTGDAEEALEGEEDDEGGDFTDLLKKAGKGKGKGK